MLTLRAAQFAARRAAPALARRPCSTMNLAGDKKLTDFEKRVMVWGGAFKSRAEVPTEVPHNLYQKCQEKFRVKMNIWAMAVTLGACGAAIWVGQHNTDTALDNIDTQEMKDHATLHRELHSK